MTVLTLLCCGPAPGNAPAQRWGRTCSPASGACSTEKLAGWFFKPSCSFFCLKYCCSGMHPPASWDRPGKNVVFTVFLPFQTHLGLCWVTAWEVCSFPCPVTCASLLINMKSWQGDRTAMGMFLLLSSATPY